MFFIARRQARAPNAVSRADGRCERDPGLDNDPPLTSPARWWASAPWWWASALWPGCCPEVRTDEAGLVCEDDCLNAVADPELHQDAGDVDLYGRLTDDQLGGDLAVRLAGREQPEHLQLAAGGPPPRRRS